MFEINPEVVSVTFTFTCVNSENLVLAYLDEKRNLRKICIEIAGFTKLLFDGK